MPVSSPSMSRRRFLAQSLAAASAAFVPSSLFAAPAQHDPNRFALFSDTHIAGDRNLVARGTNMADNFAQAVREVLRCKPQPAAVLVCGDCAYLKGTAEDYAVLHALIQPLRTAGIEVHMALGNHDHRERFWKIVEEGHPRPSPVEHRHVTVLEAPAADWFLLDSLDETNKTPGVLGKTQLDWLAKALERRGDKPVLVMVHHNPDSRPKPSGLVETAELFELLAGHPQVKALFFGHSHRYHVARHKSFYLVNLPPVAYVFSQGAPNGWIDARLRPDGMTLELHAMDKRHPLDGKCTELTWTK